MKNSECKWNPRKSETRVVSWSAKYSSHHDVHFNVSVVVAACVVAVCDVVVVVVFDTLRMILMARHIDITMSVLENNRIGCFRCEKMQRWTSWRRFRSLPLVISHLRLFSVSTNKVNHFAITQCQQPRCIRRLPLFVTRKFLFKQTSRLLAGRNV